jgi:hypothetical protein
MDEPSHEGGVAIHEMASPFTNLQIQDWTGKYLDSPCISVKAGLLKLGSGCDNQNVI